MAEKFQNRYRIPSARNPNWNYADPGAYFITICTKDRRNFFGDIVDGKMHLSPIGVLADVFWHEITNHAKHIELGAFVVMPNHIHGILILNRDASNSDNTMDHNTGENVIVEKTHAFSLQQHDESPQTIGQQRFQNQGKNSVSSIIGGYKSAVTKHANRLNFLFAWQPSFHDHIIHNQSSFETIADYIANNPENWENDMFYNGGARGTSPNPSFRPSSCLSAHRQGP